MVDRSGYWKNNLSREAIYRSFPELLFTDVLVIGGGSSGITAAIAAAHRGCGVVLADRMDRVGKKLLATGNGRCNLSNTRLSSDRYGGANVSLGFLVIEKYNLDFTLEFFRKIGLHTAVESGGRIYPRSFQASSVLDVLRAESSRMGVLELCSHDAVSVEKQDGGFTTRFESGASVQSRKVIIATGGKAAPHFGSNGGGYTLATRLGHRLTPLFPALVQIKLETAGIKGLKGVRLNGSASMLGRDGSVITCETGEFQFTEYGISGVPALNLSKYVYLFGANAKPRRRREEIDRPETSGIELGEIELGGNNLVLSLDLFPEFGNEQITSLFRERRTHLATYPIDFFFTGLVNKKLTPLLFSSSDIVRSNRTIGSMRDQEIAALSKVSKDWRLRINGTMSYSSAQTSYGGLALEDFNIPSLESKIVSGLYAAGEILDITGDCGGYNLQWAWSSGYAAGDAAGEAVSAATGATNGAAAGDAAGA
ncbi:MAG: aminoacetone oxidase family FAD-binding enzyme, partial [Oscillospiraceae bacterium]|nr:aminoacetone oxidase family FAD-binding enzyme [Oscillospiraceae bacterium]